MASPRASWFGPHFPRCLAANARSARNIDTVADNGLSNLSPEEVSGDYDGINARLTLLISVSLTLTSDQTNDMDIRDEMVEHLPRLRRYARALIHNQELADDLVQDTLERALGQTKRFQAGTDLWAWLFTIMHNLFANQVRKASARAIHVPVDDSVAESEFSVQADQTRALEVRDLYYALQRLPAEQREVVLLVGLEEMSYAEVALALDIPIGTVMSRLSRGRERLRGLMLGTQPGARLKVVRGANSSATSQE
jgi:RNA polymerase sigma-70 factor, ECF subfamily